MTNIERALQVADAVLYEGYLLYPYRATSGKNQSRWQFGVLGPPGAADAGVGEDARMSTQLLIRSASDTATVTVRLRCLQLQRRVVEQRVGPDTFEPVDESEVDGRRLLTWDEAVEQQPSPPTWSLAELAAGVVQSIELSAGEQVESVSGRDGRETARLRRIRRPVQARLSAHAQHIEGTELARLHIEVENVTAQAAGDVAAAIASSLIGAHLVLSVDGAQFLSMTDPPADAAAAAEDCRQHRCWPVLAGPEGDSSLLLVSPIILYDHPEIAEQSPGALFDSTEIDEILTLRVMTMTDEEKATARATDPKAAAIIDRCDAMSPEAMDQLHGILRDPQRADLDDFRQLRDPSDLSTTFGFDGEVPWWDPAVDGSVDPSTDAVLVAGISIRAGSTVRLHPNRRADAQDIFFADQLAKVTAVHSDVDGETHVAVVLVDDPAAEMHEWYGRYLYFAPDEIEPVSDQPTNREESRS